MNLGTAPFQAPRLGGWKAALPGSVFPNHKRNRPVIMTGLILLQAGENAAWLNRYTWRFLRSIRRVLTTNGSLKTRPVRAPGRMALK
jgi:hypothetical protein